MKHLKRFVIPACCLLLVACDSWWTYRLPMQAGEELNQAVAMRLSTEVIRQAGYDPADFDLDPVRPDDPPDRRYFGTGPAQPAHVYVMWKHKHPSQGRLGLTVSIEVRDRIAMYKLSWWH